VASSELNICSIFILFDMEFCLTLFCSLIFVMVTDMVCYLIGTFWLIKNTV